MKSILVIEDNPEVRENLCEILELSNYDVRSAENGKIGVQVALANPPDLIICDVMMPELDGFGVLRILSKKPATFDIPFIFLTAKADKMDFRKGMNLGADDYITKPFDDVELLDAIEVRLSKSERLHRKKDDPVNTFQMLVDEARGQQALQELSEQQSFHEFRKKDNLYSEGDYPNKVFYVKSGKVKVFKTNEWGKEYIIDLHSNGSFFGYQALIAGTPYVDSAAVMESSEIAFIPKAKFLELLYGNRDIAASFIKLLANEVEEKEGQLLQLAYDSIRKRVALALVELHEKHQSDRGTISIPREDLANLVGTAKESVIRTLGDFKSEGLIKIEHTQITVLELEKLRNLPG